MDKQHRNPYKEHKLFYRWAKRLFYNLSHQNTISKLLKAKYAAFQISNVLIILSTAVAFGLVVTDFGYNQFYSHEITTFTYFGYVFIILRVLYVFRLLVEWSELLGNKAKLYNVLQVVLVFYLGTEINKIVILPEVVSSVYIIRKSILFLGITFLFLAEFSTLLKYLYQRRRNTAFVFIASFFFIILIGSLLLMLPNATTKPISFVDALFTSASAVCVTGLTVLDTAQDFTGIGQFIILMLIQIGGLGIMTFAGLFAYLATGSVSFHNQMALKSMVSSDRISNVITIITRILIVTFFFETMGAIFIYFSTAQSQFNGNIARIFFAIFHSVSAFCNAGFSTESAGLYTETLRYNYFLHIIIALLIILGGMGFPIVFNLFSYLRLKLTRLLNNLMNHSLPEVRTRIVQVNSKLAFATTGILLLIGFFSYLLLEQQGTLIDHETITGKIVTSFFGSVTPRTAGFNTVDLTQMTLPMVMFYLLLMWIGASPASTGGGIKTTTAAVAFLNLRSVVRDRKRTEVFRTQISEGSINRAFAIIITSLLVIGVTVLLISIYDGDKGILKIAFESFSAFSTVGLTLGITPQLSDFSKVVLVITMFIGRVGTLTLLMAFIAKANEQPYQYPDEEIQF